MVREGVGTGGEMTQALYAHMNNKTIKKKEKKTQLKKNRKIRVSGIEDKVEELN
jgi:hypothetical protein